MVSLGDVPVAEQWIEDPALRQRFRFAHSTDPDGSEVLHVEAWIQPGGGVPRHVHPAMEERFNVLDGRPSFLAGKEWIDAGPGEEIVVPPGMRHAYRNRSDAPAHFRCDVRPPSSLQAFLEGSAELSRGGYLTGGGMIKPRGLVRGATLAHRHRDMVTLLFPPTPPVWLQRLLFPLLAAAGRRRGY
jgi:quercetin dioxygenase-like cupin family protein